MKRKSTRHTSLTDNGAKVCQLLKRAGFRPHPGPISARSGRGGALRVKISADQGRTRIRIAGGGVQEVFLYGTVELQHLVDILSLGLGSHVIESVVSPFLNNSPQPPPASS